MECRPHLLVEHEVQVFGAGLDEGFTPAPAADETDQGEEGYFTYKYVMSLGLPDSLQWGVESSNRYLPPLLAGI